MINIITLIFLTAAAIGTLSIGWQLVVLPLLNAENGAFQFGGSYDPVRNLLDSIQTSAMNASVDVKANPRVIVGFGSHINVMVNDELLSCVRRQTGANNPFEVFARREIERLESEEAQAEYEEVYEHDHSPRIYVNDSRLWSTYVNCIKSSGAQTHNPAGAAYFFAYELVSRGYKILLGANPGKFLAGMLPRRVKVPFSKSFFSEDVHILLRTRQYAAARRAVLSAAEAAAEAEAEVVAAAGAADAAHSALAETLDVEEEDAETLVELHNDENNGHLEFVGGEFQRSLEEFDARAFVMTGLRSLVGFEHDVKRMDSVFTRLETLLSRLPVAMRVHYDVECVSDALMRRVVQHVLPYVDSLSVAEPEVDLLNAFLLYGERRSVDPEELRNGNLTEVLDVARTIFMTLSQNALRNGRRKLTRLHVNSDQFQFVIREFDSFRPNAVPYWDNLENAVASSCQVVLNATCALLGTSTNAVLSGTSQSDGEAEANSGSGSESETATGKEKKKVRLDVGLRGEHYSTALPFSLFGKMRRLLPNDRVFCWRERFYDFCSAPCPRCVEVGEAQTETRPHEDHAHEYHHHIDLNWPLISAHALGLQL